MRTNGKPPKDHSVCGKDHYNYGKKFGKQWKKGQSGNPKGMPPKWPRIAELTQVHTEAAVATLAEIMTNPENKPTERVLAANSLLDRTYGKAAARLNVDGEINITTDFLDALKAVNERGHRALEDGSAKSPITVEAIEVVDD